MEKSVKEVYIKAKYEEKRFLQYRVDESRSLEEQLAEAVTESNLMRTVEIITKGVDKDFLDSNGSSFLDLAKSVWERALSLLKSQELT